jgi:hypothetical protein
VPFFADLIRKGTLQQLWLPLVRPLRRIHNRVYDERHALAIYLSDLTGGNEPIKLISLHSGDGFFFPNFPLTRIEDQLAANASSISMRLGSTATIILR